MNRKYVYWISTGILSLFYLLAATFYGIQGDKVRQMLGALGYPAYLVPVLLVVKLLAVTAVLSRVSVVLSDLAYAGMFYHLLLAISAHINAGDSVGSIPGVIGLALVFSSFFTQNTARSKKSPYVREE